MGTSFQPAHAGQANSDVTYSCSRPDLETALSQEGPLAPARAVAMVRQIAAALDAAHDAGLIHRDVKPANVLLTTDDFVCLVDFGLANAASDAKLTSTGFTFGTFAYMAPERLSASGELDRRVDVYALACVLYELLTGSPPYSGDVPALVAAHLTAPIPRPSQHGSGVPEAFDEVIACGMAKNASERFGSAGDLARAAQHALSTAEHGQSDTIAASTPVATERAPHLGATLIASPVADPSAKTASAAKLTGRPLKNMASRVGGQAPVRPSVAQPPSVSTQPFRLLQPLTDQAAVLGGLDPAPIELAIDKLYRDRNIHLWVVLVQDFGGYSAGDWARRSFSVSGLGSYDVVLAIATDTRRHAFLVPMTVLKISPGQVEGLCSQIETALRAGDWVGAAVVAATGLGSARR